MLLPRYMSSPAYIVLLTIIFSLSFRSFAAYLTPDLNSDHAIHILMTYDLKLPQDLYYWGQDRLGSLLPILGHLLLQIFPIAPVKAASYVQYFLILVGYISLSSLFQTRMAKLLFALAWFLPFTYFQPLLMLAQPYAPQFACVGVAIVFLNQAAKAREHNLSHTVFWMTIATLCLFLSLWLSDLSFILLFLLLIKGCDWAYKSVATSGSRQGQQTSEGLVAIDRHAVFRLLPEIVAVGGASIVGAAFVYYAKQHAPTPINYKTFATAQQIQEVVAHLFRSLANTLTFQTSDWLISIHAILVVILIGYLGTLYYRQVHQEQPISEWFYLFAINAILSLIVVTLSKWLYVNDISLRYFTVTYVSSWIAILLWVETLRKPAKALSFVLLSLIAICSSLTLPHSVFAVAKAAPAVEQLQDMRSLGEAGLIGEYWHSYVLCSVNPQDLDCTASDPRGRTPCKPKAGKKLRIRKVRCFRCAHRVLKAQEIYLVQDDWLETFPTEIQQFGQCLVKAGEPRQVAGYSLAPYKLKNASSA